ncbi:MAG: hypothetical protein JST04_14195 [Bdellovibrionales bacterium]|nr:hypothetical protein [Bdellovibrionales bacterium]
MTDPEKPPVPNSDDSFLGQFAMFGVTLGQFLGASAVGVGFGWLLWKKAGFPWWTLLVGALLGLGAASYQVIRIQRRLANEPKKGGKT